MIPVMIKTSPMIFMLFAEISAPNINPKIIEDKMEPKYLQV